MLVDVVHQEEVDLLIGEPAILKVATDADGFDALAVPIGEHATGPITTLERPTFIAFEFAHQECKLILFHVTYLLRLVAK